MKKMIIVFAIMFFSWFIYDQASEMKSLRNRDKLMFDAAMKNDTETLLAMEKQFYDEMQSGKWQSQYIYRYMYLLEALEKWDKIIEVFDKDRASDRSLRLGLTERVCLARTKLNQNGKECAEEILAILRTQPHYYDKESYWLFVILADQQAEVEEDIHKSKIDEEILRVLLEKE